MWLTVILACSHHACDVADTSTASYCLSKENTGLYIIAIVLILKISKAPVYHAIAIASS